MKKFLFIITITVFFVFGHMVLAGERTDTGVNDQKCPENSVCLDNPISVDTPQAFIGNIIKAILGITGSLALVMFIYGGFTWMTAAGSPDGVKKGKDILIWATIGLVVIFSAYGLVKFVFTSLGV